MSTPDYFVMNPEDYRALYARASAILRLDRGGLPEQVFADGFSHFRFLEFDVMLFPKFWNVLAACAAHCGDAEVSLIVHEPDPEAYYFANFGRYGARRFDRTASADDYYEALRAEPKGSPADALLYVGNIISWCGSLEQWAFWGERDLGVGVAATSRTDMSWPHVEGIKWVDVDAALSDLIAPNFENQSVPEDFAATLRRNYTAQLPQP